MEIDKLENPFIKVTWEDNPENFTQEKLKRVRSYFQNKYNSRNITVLTKSVDRDSSELDIDIEQNVMDTNYQKDLMTQFVERNDIEIDINLLKRLDEKVNSKMSEEMTIDTHYKRVYIKNIKFSNFLSFGDGNKVDISALGGITVIDSNPPNFGGKSVLAVDLILFLFFNTTTKTTKAAEIFNRFRGVNEVVVQGEVEIDGRDFTIVRKVKRRKTKRGEWSVSTSLEFLEKKSDGSLQNFTGEQRRETESFIKESIGTMNDFLLTVLTTASNIESIIESKPTERGNILSRFVGLEILKEKESVGKKMYSEWSKKLISNVYNIEELKQEIKNLKSGINVLINKNTESEKSLLKTKEELKLKNTLRDKLILEKINDIDKEIENVNPRLVEGTISEEKTTLDLLKSKLKVYGDKEVPEEIDLTKLRKETEERNNLNLKRVQNKTNLNNLTNTLKNLIESETCPMCKQNLKNVDHTEEISKLKKEIKVLEGDIIKKDKKIKLLDVNIDDLNTKKIVFDEYEKELLKKERLVLEIAQKDLTLEKLESKLSRWKANKEKLENNTKIEQKILTHNSSIDQLNNTKENLVREIEYNSNTITTHEKEIKDKKSKIDKINKENDVDKIFRAYLTVYGKNGIIKTIMKSIVPKLNNELMRLLNDVTEFCVEIRVNEKNEVEFWMVDNNTQVEKLVSAGSGFEKTLSALAIRTVLTKVSCLPRPNITVFDEVLGKVSNENLEQVSVFFNKVKEYFENIFLITHNPLVREWGDNIITVTKKNNVSMLK